MASITPIMWDERLYEADIALSADHPLSLGYLLRVVTDHPNFIGRSWTGEDIVSYIGGSSGMLARWDKHRQYVLFIAWEEGMSVTRLIELVVHEVSHFVDHMMDLTAVQNVDTEVRAYYMDYAVGKVLRLFDELSFPTKKKNGVSLKTRAK